MKLSVVIPAYNEEKDISKALDEVIAAFPQAEVIVVDDASTDNMPNILKEYKNVRVLRNEVNRGHGYSVIRGLKEATGDWILYIDADRQIAVDSFKFLKDIDKLESLYSGNQFYAFISGKRKDRQDKGFRLVVSYLLRCVIFFRHGMRVRDANCPYKLYKRDAVQKIIPYLPETYVIPIACLEVLARRRGYRMATIGIVHKPYEGVRKGFLQAINKKFVTFLVSAFKEIWTI